MDDIQEMHLNLRQQLQRLETTREQIGEAIIEVQRRIGILDEALSWSPIEVHQELSPEQAFRTVDAEEPWSLIEVEPNRELPLEDAFRTVDAEDTEIQWVNR